MQMASYRTSRQWLVVGIGALVLAGLLSFVLVAGRAPVIQHFITDPEFARRSLVVHVNLSLFVWLSSILASIYALLPAFKRKPFVIWEPPYLAMTGVVLLLLSGASRAVPVMSNYIPVLQHPVFFLGMGMVLMALVATYIRAFPIRWRVSVEMRHPVLPVSVQYGLHWAAGAFLLAVSTLAITFIRMPQVPNVTSFYDWLFWGAGHVLQLVHVVGMMNVWLIIFHNICPNSHITPRQVNGLFAVLVLPWLYALYLAYHANHPGVYYVQFTRLMQFAIFPGVVGFLVVLAYAYIRNKGTQEASLTHRALKLGWLTSSSLIIIGFVLGAFIRVSNTLVPAHYHAAIGSITVSYMVIAYLLLERFGFSISSLRLKRITVWQPVVFGLGQTIFAFGFGLAGLTRKVYGAEQHIRTLKEMIGMGLVGIGGLMAITGGVLFIVVILTSISPAISLIIQKRRALWKAIKSIPFKS